MRMEQERFSVHGATARQTGCPRGFTLVELLVVVSIIALLVAILVPALGGVRDRAKATATLSQISGLSTGLESYKQESGLGGSYPCSHTDSGTPGQMANPFAVSGNLGSTTGASLLVYALNGADGLGTAGFIDRGDPQQGEWWDNMGADPNSTPVGAYAIGLVGQPNAGEPLVPRYGPYADTDTLLKSIKSIGEIIDEGVFREPGSSDWWTTDGDFSHLAFTDSWGHPVLYYRARRGARAIVPTTTGLPGIYDPEDNEAVTGQTNQAGGVIIEGLHIRVGGQPKPHPLGYVEGNLLPTTSVTVLEAGPYAIDPAAGTLVDSFEHYVWDSTVTARPTPVNKKTFLLISPGPDGIYGTPDDVTNFGKN